jgi:cell division septal protein FtsQ
MSHDLASGLKPFKSLDYRQIKKTAVTGLKNTKEDPVKKKLSKTKRIASSK